jgi:carbon storage regulator CsrA
MLILNRRVGETIVIGDREINVIVLAATSSRVTLGIEADQDIPIFREELLAKPEQENDYVH